MTQEALNIAGQCRATASSPLAKNILVDEGNGLLTELLLDAARIIEALAQPKQEPVAWMKARDTEWSISFFEEYGYIPLYTAPPQRTEQEPVMWSDYESNGIHHKPVAWMDSDGNVSDNNDHKCFPIPLYTTPPQRKPLTENEIKHLWYEACQTNLELTSQLIVHLARNIEAAHGIKENT